MKHRSPIFLVILQITCSSFCYSQQFDSLSIAFSSLPDTLFPHGFLHDQSPLKYHYEGSDYDAHNFDGSTNSPVVTQAQTEILYHDLLLSQRSNSVGLNGGSSALKPWTNFQSQSDSDTLGVDVPLFLNAYKIHEIDTNALQKGWLYFDGKKFLIPPTKQWLDSDQTISSLCTHPLDSALKAIQDFEVFFGGSNVSAHYIPGNQFNVSFSLFDFLVQSNQALPAKFEVDLDDGQGFRSVGLNQKIQTNYSTVTTAPELVTKELQIKARLGNKYKITRFKISLIFNADIPDVRLYTENLPFPGCYQGPIPSKEASISIKYANPASGIQKPVVLVEGFESATRAYGDISYEGLATGIILNQDNNEVFPQMKKISWMYDSLLQNGFDIVHVDFEESKIDIHENVSNFVKVLHWIDLQSPTEPAVVIGASLGGIIARAALLELERLDCCLNISGFGTFDSPHDGAFIPLSIQKSAKQLEQTALGLLPRFQVWTKVLNSDAARQMLIKHLDTTARYSRNSLNELLKDEQPSQMRRFAISNGSDMNVIQLPQDTIGRIAAWGWNKWMTHKHKIGAHPDTLAFNRSGGLKRNVLATGALLDSYSGSSTYFYQGQKYLSTYWLSKRIRWISQASSRRSYLIDFSTILGIPRSKADAAILANQNETNRVLNNLHQRILAKSERLDKSIQTSDFFNCPGSTSNSAESYIKLWNAQIYSTLHTFIPSFSALDVGMNYMANSFRNQMDLIPFHSYLSPGILNDVASNNQAHIYTDEKTIDFALESIRSLGTFIGTNGALKSDLNIAKVHNSYSSYHTYLNDLVVNNGVVLSIGGSGFVNQSTVLTDPIQNIEVFIGKGCTSSDVKVEGTLELGGHVSRKAILRVKKGSRLILASTGVLNIGPGSKLIIEEGAEFEIKKGARIYWDDGGIKNSGVISLENKANFEPIGEGIIVFDGGTLNTKQQHHISFVKSSVILKSPLIVPKFTGYIDFDETSVLFQDQGQLELFSNSIFTNVSVSYQGLKEWNGLVIHSKSEITDSQFDRGNPALTCSRNAQLYLKKSEFNNALKGIKSLARPKLFYGNSFINCTHGAELKAGGVTVENSLFQSCQRGLTILNDSTSNTVVLAKNIFSYNTQYGSFCDGIDSRLTCNEWSYNEIGHLQKGKSIYMGGNAGNSYSSNTTALKFFSIKELRLSNGHNAFTSNSLDIRGTYNLNPIIPFNGVHYYISADYTSFSGLNSTDIVHGRSKVYPVKNSATQPSALLCPNKGPGKIEFQGEVLNNEHSLRISPNPASNNDFTVWFSSAKEEGTMIFYDMNGKKVAQEFIQRDSNHLNVSLDTTPGVYIVILMIGERYEATRLVLL